MKPILRDFSDRFETARLLIRAPQPGEGALVNAAIVESLDELRPWMPWVQPVPTVDDSEAHSREAHAKFLARTDLHWRLWHRETGEFVGSSGLHPRQWEVPSFEIGYWCRTRFAGQGYISEAVRGLTRFGFETLGARRIEIRCDARNERSRRVAAQCGYRLEGCLHHAMRAPDGTLRDTLVFALLAED